MFKPRILSYNVSQNCQMSADWNMFSKSAKLRLLIGSMFFRKRDIHIMIWKFPILLPPEIFNMFPESVILYCIQLDKDMPEIIRIKWVEKELARSNMLLT